MYEQFDNELKQLVQRQCFIPKPKSNNTFKLIRLGKRRNECAIIYSIPNHRNANKPYLKGITFSEFHKAFEKLQVSGEITCKWFNQNLPECAKEGGCNFTTLGGILELLNYTTYFSKGIYIRSK